MTFDSSKAQRDCTPLAGIAHKARPDLARAAAFALCAAMLLLGATVTSAVAADLVVQQQVQRPGQLFAEGARVPAVAARGKEAVDLDFWIPNSPKVPGYYGRPGDFHYRNYYGTSPLTIYSRLPYACGFVGLC